MVAKLVMIYRNFGTSFGATDPFFFWKRGEFGELRRDEAKTAELYEKLGSVLPRDAVEAVLEYLYLVRCNIFHGSKALEKSHSERYSHHRSGAWRVSLSWAWKG